MSAKKKSSIPMPQIILDARRGDPAAVKAAIDNGADVNALDRGGGPALHQAVVNHHVPVVKALLAAKADARIADAAGWTALHFAAQERQAEIAKLLLDAGAEVDAQDQNGNTPLWRAVFATKDDPELIRLGADRMQRREFV
jgi:ankyrin repeat protein